MDTPVDICTVVYEVSEIEDVVPPLSTDYWSFTNGGSIATVDGETVLRVPDTASKTTQVLLKAAQVIPVVSGQVLKWSLDIRKTADDVGGDFGFYLNGVTSSASQVLSNLIFGHGASWYSTEWQTLTGEFTVPDGMEYMRIILNKAANTAGSQGFYEVKNLKITTDETSIVRTLDILSDEVEVVYEEENTNG